MPGNIMQRVHPRLKCVASRSRFFSSASGVGDSSVQQRVAASSWHGLGAFTTSPTAVKAWRELKSKEQEVDSLVNSFPAHHQGAAASIDWDYWERSIAHTPLVNTLKAAYQQQVKLIETALGEESKSVVPNEWKLYDEAVADCQQSVKASEDLVADGARALWVSHRNPPAWTVDTEEWLDSDLHWQAYLERHHHYDPTKDTSSYTTDTFEDMSEAMNKEWNDKVNLFHDRSDTPTLYMFMDQLHSYEYYDLHRRAFLEHMLYFLVRTGHDHKFFPEIPPTSWMTDLQDIRYRYLSLMNKLRLPRQLAKLSQEEPLELLPLDSDIDHDGEEHFSHLLQKEANNWNQIVGRLMADYMFLCYPAIPCQTTSALQRARRVDNGQGSIYSLGDDISALFYVPSGVPRPFPKETDNTQLAAEEGNTTNVPLPPRPTESIEKWLRHLRATRAHLNPGYDEIVSQHARLLEKRGSYWLTAPSETVAEAFLRRLAVNDPQRPVYEAYTKELETRWGEAVLIENEDEIARKIEQTSKAAETFMSFYNLYRATFDSEEQAQMGKLVRDIAQKEEQEAKTFAGLVEGKQISLVGDSEADISPTEGMAKRIASAQRERALLSDILNTTKLPTI